MKYQKRIPKENVADWENEEKVYKKMGIEIKFQENGIYLRKWIDGKVIKKWNQKKIESLQMAIEEMHSKNPSGIIKHDWMKVETYKDEINSDIWNEYISLVKRIKKHNQVLSHNDINGLNVLWTNKKIVLIDFEWSRKNSEFYDYAQFEVAEGIDIRPGHMDIDKYEETKKAIIIFNYLWTFSMKNTKKLIKLKNEYKKMLEI